ncbi:MAG: nitrite reductase small subunit NirD [Acidimicrobiales bacterium]
MTLTAPSPTITHSGRWADVCAFDQLVSERGVCARVEAHQVAVFRVGDDIFALSNYDPFSKANVLSRGIVGSQGDRLKVASPVYKQSFDLRSGECLTDPAVSVPTFAVRVERGRVQVAHP